MLETNKRIQSMLKGSNDELRECLSKEIVALVNFYSVRESVLLEQVFLFNLILELETKRSYMPP